MNSELLEKYFRDQCSPEELDRVLDWFQTAEGQAFLARDMELQRPGLPEGSLDGEHGEIESEKIFRRIQRRKNNTPRRQSWVWTRVASVLLVVGILSAGAYWMGTLGEANTQNPAPDLVTYQTAPGQQKIVSFSDGTSIRLNEGARLTAPKKFSGPARVVTLRGEAYFEVTPNPGQPFIVKAPGSVVEVLGTKFNVRTGPAAQKVQVAVLKGRVALTSDANERETRAILTRNNVGILHLPDSRITIEKGNTQNYLSWINGRLIFSGQPLARVSRQLQQLYDVDIRFRSDRLKDLRLTADIEKTDLPAVLATISKTFDIQHEINGNEVVWTE